MDGAALLLLRPLFFTVLFMELFVQRLLSGPYNPAQATHAAATAKYLADLRNGTLGNPGAAPNTTTATMSNTTTLEEALEQDDVTPEMNIFVVSMLCLMFFCNCAFVFTVLRRRWGLTDLELGADFPAIELEPVNPGLSRASLAKLPVVTFPFKPKDKSEVIEFQTTCPICIDDYEDGQKLRLLPCNHVFHKACVDEWFARSTRCPMCKHPCSHQQGAGSGGGGAAAVVPPPSPQGIADGPGGAGGAGGPGGAGGGAGTGRGRVRRRAETVLERVARGIVFYASRDPRRSARVRAMGPEAAAAGAGGRRVPIDDDDAFFPPLGGGGVPGPGNRLEPRAGGAWGPGVAPAGEAAAAEGPGPGPEPGARPGPGREEPPLPPWALADIERAISLSLEDMRHDMRHSSHEQETQAEQAQEVEETEERKDQVDVDVLGGQPTHAGGGLAVVDTRHQQHHPAGMMMAAAVAVPAETTPTTFTSPSPDSVSPARGTVNLDDDGVADGKTSDDDSSQPNGGESKGGDRRHHHHHALVVEEM